MTAKTEPQTEPTNPKNLVDILRGMGLTEASAATFATRVGEQVAKDKTRAEAEEKLAKTQTHIATALADIVKSIGVDFNVTVRSGKIDVHLVGAGGGGSRTVSAPKATPVKDACRLMGIADGNELVKAYGTDAEKALLETELDSNKRYFGAILPTAQRVLKQSPAEPA